MFREGALDLDTRDGLLKVFDSVEPPKVIDGPVVVGLGINLWGGSPEQKADSGVSQELLFPQQWIAAVKDTDEKLQIPISDGALKVVWPD